MKDKNAINVGKLMREYSELNVSPKAVEELSGRILDRIFDISPYFDKIAKSHDRKTVMEEDVVEFFGVYGRNVF